MKTGALETGRATRIPAARSISSAPGVNRIGITSGRRLRIPFGALGLLSRLGRSSRGLRLRRRLLFATVFPLEFLPQFALNAGMRRHDLTIRLCQSV